MYEIRLGRQSHKDFTAVTWLIQRDVEKERRGGDGCWKQVDFCVKQVGGRERDSNGIQKECGVPLCQHHSVRAMSVCMA